MRIMTLQANVACGIDPLVTSNPASYPFSLQPAFFVESSCATICDSSHAYINFFLFSAENSTSDMTQEQVFK